LVNQDGLKYNIGWSGEINEEYTVGYKVMIKDGDDVTEVGRDMNKNAVEMTVDLEDFSGDNVDIYVVSLADPKNNGEIYYDSPAGTSTNETILKRLDRPDVNFKWNDEFTSDDGYVSEEDFASESSKLYAEVTGPSKLNGSYLIYGVLYKTREEAEADLEQLNNLIPDSGIITNTVNKSIMVGVNGLIEAGRLYAFGFNSRKIAEDEGSTTSPFTYSLALENFGNGDEEWSLKYAGRYVLPLIRSTGNTDISSTYSWSNILKLPKVKFDVPNVTKDSTSVEMKGGIYALPRYNMTARQEMTSTMEFDTYSWSRPDKCEDSFDVSLTLNTNKMSEEGSVNTWEENAKLSIFTEIISGNEYLAAEIEREGLSVTKETVVNAVKEAEEYDAALDEAEDTESQRRVVESEEEAGLTIYYTLDEEGNVNTNEYYTVSVTDDYTAYGYNGDVYFVEKEITTTDDVANCKLIIPGFTNYIAGRVLYDGTNYTYYLFKKNLVLQYEGNEDEHKYSLMVPKPSGAFSFSVEGDSGNSFECSTEYSGNYIASGSFMTYGEDDSEQYISSDVIEIEDDILK
ncbi:MAG: hypothetical protein K6G11_04570, partial [Lachnospiraceae bacterium]|nr:hypothetical protein [Lachnospiraceae bacterium]